MAHNLSFGDFVDQVMALTTEDGAPMLSVDSVMEALADEGFYKSLRGK